MSEYVTCPFCKRNELVIENTGIFWFADCDYCTSQLPRQPTREAMLAVIAGTHYDGPEVV